MDKSLESEIVSKANQLQGMIANKFGGNPSATAKGGQEMTQTEVGMRVTRSDASNAPGEVRDGKLIDVKQLASAAAKQDVPPTDLLALARANDPHNEDNIPETIAGAVVAAGGGTANVEQEVKQQLHTKQHPPIEKAVNTDVNSQVSNEDPYKSLHASAEIEQIVARTKAAIKGAREIVAETEVKDNPGKGKVEGLPGQAKATGADADKDPQASGKTLAQVKSRKDILAAIRERIAKGVQARVEGHPIDPAKGEDAGKTPEESASTLGDGGTKERLAEAKDRPVAPVSGRKLRYDPDKDPRDEIAESYWSKAKKDEARWSAEEKAERPLNRETQEKMPKLAGLLRRLAGVLSVITASDEAERLHLQRKQYSKDTPKDVDWEGAAGRTESEIKKEHSERERGSHPFSPLMSKLWAAYGPNRTAADTGYKGTVETKGGDLKKQIGEMQTAIKGFGSGAEGSESQMQAMQGKVESMESEMAKSSGVRLNLGGIEAVASACERLAAIKDALSDISSLCAASHIELRFAKEDEEGGKPESEPKDKPDFGGKGPKDKPEAKKPMPKPMGGVVDQTTKLVQDLGETAEDMEDAIEALMDEMGIEPKKKELAPAKPGAKGPPPVDIKDDLPSVEPEGLPAPGAGPKPPFMGASFKAQFTKVASEADKTKADMLSSYWEVMRGDEVVLKATVAQLYPVKTAEEQAKAFAWCATKEYGKKLLTACKTEGVEKTAKLLGVEPMVKTSAEKALDKKIKDEKAYFAKAYGSDQYASELVKEHKAKADAEKADLLKKLAFEKGRNDRMEADMTMRAKAERALRLAQVAVGKGVLAEEKKAGFIDSLMTGDDVAFKAAEQIVNDFTQVAKAPEGEVKEAGKTSARELLRTAAAGPGLKTPVVIASQAASPFTGLQGQLEDMWRKPPTAQQGAA